MITSVLSACETFAKCADDPQVLELFTNYSNQSQKDWQKCFVCNVEMSTTLNCGS